MIQRRSRTEIQARCRSVSNQDNVASGAMLSSVMRPSIKDVAQADVGQQRGNDGPLRGAPFGRNPPAVFDDPSL